jgi:hypothetical protein
MGNLTPEERLRIYLEEKARSEAQDQVKEEKSVAATKKGFLACLGLTAVFAIVIFAMWPSGSDRPSSAVPSSIRRGSRDCAWYRSRCR